MMFANDSQACRAISALLEASGLPSLRGLWTPSGPTARACEVVEDGGGGMSSGEELLLRVAFDFWNGQGGARFSDLFHVLDARRLELVVSLARAANNGGEAVARWLSEIEKGGAAWPE